MQKIKILFTVAFLFVAYCSFSQAKEQYALVMAQAKPFSTKVTITVDFGQPTKAFTDTRMKDEMGKVVSFNSVVDVLNYMNSQGWVYVDAYTVTVANQNVYHYLLKKPIIE